MRLALVLALALVGCADADAPPVTVDGVDPVQTDGDLAPDTGLAPDSTALAPDSDLAPEGTLQP